MDAMPASGHLRRTMDDDCRMLLCLDPYLWDYYVARGVVVVVVVYLADGSCRMGRRARERRHRL